MVSSITLYSELKGAESSAANYTQYYTLANFDSFI